MLVGLLLVRSFVVQVGEAHDGVCERIACGGVLELWLERGGVCVGCGGGLVVVWFFGVEYGLVYEWLSVWMVCWQLCVGVEMGVMLMKFLVGGLDKTLRCARK